MLLNQKFYILPICSECLFHSVSTKIPSLHSSPPGGPKAAGKGPVAARKSPKLVGYLIPCPNSNSVAE